jgi:hypothetical protein
MGLVLHNNVWTSYRIVKMLYKDMTLEAMEISYNFEQQKHDISALNFWDRNDINSAWSLSAIDLAQNMQLSLA